MSLPALRLPAQPVIDQHQRHHCLTHRHEPRQQTRVVAALDGDLGRLAFCRDGALWLWQAAGGFDGNAADDGLTAGDAAEHSAMAIGGGRDVGYPHPRPLSRHGRGGKRNKRVVILAAT